jgi:hypothetical protein
MPKSPLSTLPGLPSVLSLGLAIAAIAIPLPAQLSGTYTINAAGPATGTNFTSLTQATMNLETQGISGPVTFEIFDDGGPHRDSMPFSTLNATFGTSDAVLTLGTWPGAVAGRRVTFRAAAGEHPVLDATGRAMGVFWNGADDVTIEGLEIANATFDAVSIYSEAHHGQVFRAIIRRCRIHDCGGGGVVVHGNLPHPTDTLIENNFFWNLQLTNAGGFNTVARFGYVSARRTHGTVVIHNTFYVTTAVGSAFTVIGSLPGSYTETPFTEVSQNIIVKTVAPSRPIVSWPMLSGVTSMPLSQDGNCYHDLSQGLFATFGLNGQTVAGTRAAWTSATGLDAGSMDADPLLTSPATGDLHLNPGSPCIDAGARGLVVDDIDGDARDIPDIGADEWRGAPGPSVTTVGTSNAHAQGSIPLLSGLGLPALGSGLYPILVTGALPSTSVWLFAAGGTAATPLPLGAGNTLYLELSSFDYFLSQGFGPLGPLQTDASGTTVVTPYIGNDPVLLGMRLSLQGAVADPGVGPGFVTTNALNLVIR